MYVQAPDPLSREPATKQKFTFFLQQQFSLISLIQQHARKALHIRSICCLHQTRLKMTWGSVSSPWLCAAMPDCLYHCILHHKTAGGRTCFCVKWPASLLS